MTTTTAFDTSKAETFTQRLAIAAVLDVGGGSGKALNTIAKIFPHSRFQGYDFSAEAIANTQTEANQFKLSNIQFKVKGAATIDEVEKYDC